MLPSTLLASTLWRGQDFQRSLLLLNVLVVRRLRQVLMTAFYRATRSREYILHGLLKASGLELYFPHKNVRKKKEN